MSGESERQDEIARNSRFFDLTKITCAKNLHFRLSSEPPTTPLPDRLHPSPLIDHERHRASTDLAIIIELASKILRTNGRDDKPFATGRTLHGFFNHDL